MNGRHRKLMVIRIVVLLLVGLAFLIARLAHAQEPTAAELATKIYGHSCTNSSSS